MSRLCVSGRRGLPSEIGQGGADLETELVHRGFLANQHFLTLGLTLGLFGRARHVDRDLGLNLGVEVDRNGVQADPLDGRASARSGCALTENPPDEIDSAMSRVDTEP